MTWSSYLERPILQPDGRSRETPDGAWRLMLSPPGGEAPQKWQHLAGLLMTAARTAHRNLVAITTGQIERRESDHTVR